MKRYLAIMAAVLLAMLPAWAMAKCSCTEQEPVQLRFTKETCIESGYYTMVCPLCREEWKEISPDHPPKGHNWKFSGTKASVCGANGYEEYACTQCTAVKWNTFLAADHDWQLVEEQAPTCIADGYQDYACSQCAAEKTETIKSLGEHAWEHSATVEPTCKLNGYEEYTCTVCEMKRQDVLRATGEHDWESDKLTAAGCETDGSEEFKCSICQSTKTTYLPATGHNYVLFSQMKGDCMTPAVINETCSACGKKQTRDGEKGEHSYIESGRTEPGCEEKGYIEHTCSVCGGTKQDPIDAVGHNWGEAVIDTRPTCTQGGFAVSTCLVCGKEEERELSMISHTFSEWKSTKKASRRSNGVRERVCSVCGLKDVQEYTLEQASLEKAQQESQAQEGTPVEIVIPDMTEQNVLAPQEEIEQVNGTGKIEVVTTAAKVNLRSAPGKKNTAVTQVAKRNTSLGELLGSQMDKDGTVWYQVSYKKKTGWISSEYASAEFGGFSGNDPRRPQKNARDLKEFFFCDMNACAELLGVRKDGSEAEAEGILLRGGRVVEQVELTGGKTPLHGVTIGMTFKDAIAVLEKEGLKSAGGKADSHTFLRPCAANAIAVSEDGFDSTVEIRLGRDGTVSAVIWRMYLKK